MPERDDYLLIFFLKLFQNRNGTEQPIMYWCAVKKLLTDSKTGLLGLVQVFTGMMPFLSPNHCHST